MLGNTGHCSTDMSSLGTIGKPKAHWAREEWMRPNSLKEPLNQRFLLAAEAVAMACGTQPLALAI